MAKIKLLASNSPSFTVIDTDVMGVEIREAFLGVSFITEDGSKLSVSMRDDGFEVHYSADFGEQGFDAGWTEFKGGTIVRRK